jgi:hypothetical protein
MSGLVESIGAEQPFCPIGRVANLDPCRDEFVADRIRHRERLLGAGDDPCGQRRFHDGPEHVANVAQAAGGRFAEPQHHRTQGGAGAIDVVGLQRVTRPFHDGGLEGEHRSHGTVGVARSERGGERCFVLFGGDGEGVGGRVLSVLELAIAPVVAPDNAPVVAPDNAPLCLAAFISARGQTEV